MTIHTGDCVTVMAAMDAESVDAIVTDPPYGLEFMGKEWDTFGSGGRGKWATRPKGGASPFENGRQPVYRGGTVAQEWHTRWANEALRVTKPGGYLLAFGGTRTVHRLTCALEDAGWVIRDTLVWAYASGFPKSKASLKPAWEPIVMARKPGPLRLLAIDACRIPTDGRLLIEGPPKNGADPGRFRSQSGFTVGETTIGRWPANVVLTDPVFDGGWDGVVSGGDGRSSGFYEAEIRGERAGPASIPLDNGPQYGDSGTYSRFFLIPKADRADREPVLGGTRKRVDARMGLVHGGPGELGKGSKEGYEYHPAPRVNVHPTTKPTDLMRHLVRLVTPPGGVVLDCFAGSGSTLIAATLEGFEWVGIEKEPEYVAIAEARLNGVQQGLGLSA